MPYSVGMVSLGCEKNRVDAEIMMASLEKAGFVLKDDAALADVAIVNTCGFIESAKQESIEEILELARLKQEGRIRALVVTGCMAERYREEIRRELPEADAVCGIRPTERLPRSSSRCSRARSRKFSLKRSVSRLRAIACAARRAILPTSRLPRAATTAAPTVRFP